MASTEAAREHPLGPQHLAGCLALSQAANWNQNEADWRLMLGFGRGYGVTLDDGTLAASTITLPYGDRFAWVAMVLVLPEHRRKGYATRLLRRALAELDAANRAAILDATPTGRESPTAWLVNTKAAQRLLGPPRVSLERMIDWVADWVSRGMPSLGKPTHFEARDGKY